MGSLWWDSLGWSVLTILTTNMKEAVLSLVLLLLPLPNVSQLVGNRGVVRLPDDFEYRDSETLEAARAAAAFSLKFQPKQERIIRQNKLNEERKKSEKKSSRLSRRRNISFYTYGPRLAIPGGHNDNFYFTESRSLNPPPEIKERIKTPSRSNQETKDRSRSRSRSRSVVTQWSRARTELLPYFIL